MEFQIRRAEPADVPAMLDLVRELAIFEREPEAVTVSEEHMQAAGFGEDAVWWGWVAEKGIRSGQVAGGSKKANAEILGIAMCYERYSTWRGRVMYLEDIVVTDAARNKGIGDALFRTCAAYAVKKKYHHMAWQVLDWNEGAIRFYDRLGAKLDGEWVNGTMSLDQLKKLSAI